MANGAIAASFKQLIDHRLNLGNGGEQSICVGVEQLTAQDQIFLFVAAGKQAVVPDALKARWQRMQQEAANELFGGDSHVPGFLAIGGTVILVLEGNLKPDFSAEMLRVGGNDDSCCPFFKSNVPLHTPLFAIMISSQ